MLKKMKKVEEQQQESNPCVHTQKSDVFPWEEKRSNKDEEGEGKSFQVLLPQQWASDFSLVFLLIRIFVLTSTFGGRRGNRLFLLSFRLSQDEITRVKKEEERLVHQPDSALSFFLYCIFFVKKNDDYGIRYLAFYRAWAKSCLIFFCVSFSWVYEWGNYVVQ